MINYLTKPTFSMVSCVCVAVTCMACISGHYLGAAGFLLTAIVVDSWRHSRDSKRKVTIEIKGASKFSGISVAEFKKILDEGGLVK